MPLKGLFKGDGGGGGRDGSSGGGSSSRDSSTHGGRDSKLMSKAKALLATAAAPLSARGVGCWRRGPGLGRAHFSSCAAAPLRHFVAHLPACNVPTIQRERASDRPYFNPEEHISEKREWSRRYTQSQGGAAGMGLAAPKPPDRLYEHFAVVVSWLGGAYAGASQAHPIEVIMCLDDVVGCCPCVLPAPSSLLAAAQPSTHCRGTLHPLTAFSPTAGPAAHHEYQGGGSRHQDISAAEPRGGRAGRRRRSGSGRHGGHRRHAAGGEAAAVWAQGARPPCRGGPTGQAHR